MEDLSPTLALSVLIYIKIYFQSELTIEEKNQKGVGNLSKAVAKVDHLDWWFMVDHRL